jgi:hypothetical protein
MKRTSFVMLLLSVLAVIAICTFPALAQTATAPAPPSQAVGATGLLERVAAIIAIVYPLLQGLKKLFPGLGGYVAIALNVALAATGFLVSVPSDQWFQLSTIIAFVSAVLGAAGIHGTVKALSTPSTS